MVLEDLEDLAQFAAESSTESVPLRSDGHQVTITQCASVKSNICNSGNERRSKDINWSKPSHGWNSNRFYCFFCPQKNKLDFSGICKRSRKLHRSSSGFFLTFSVFFALATSPSEVLWCQKEVSDRAQIPDNLLGKTPRKSKKLDHDFPLSEWLCFKVHWPSLDAPMFRELTPRRGGSFYWLIGFCTKYY